MLKNREEVEVNEIITFCEDILRHLENEMEEECETNQCQVGMTELFRGHANRILVRNCAKFCNECWKNRNESSHDEPKQR